MIYYWNFTDIKMELPLASELNILDEINLILPSDKYVDYDLNMLNSDEVYTIERYAMYTFPEVVWYNYFSNINSIASGLKDLYKNLLRISQGSVIISPGDSPAKYIMVFALLGWKLPPVISFPISGLGEPDKEILTETEQQILDSYLTYVFRDHNIGALNRVVFFDYSSSGKTMEHIMQSLNRIYSNNIRGVIMQPFVNRKLFAEENIQYQIVIEGDLWNKRCVPKYRVLHEEKARTINMLRCNVIISLLVLAVRNKLHQEPIDQELSEEYPEIYRKLPNIILPTIKNGSYQAVYYDIATNTIKEGVIIVDGKYISQGTTNSVLSCVIMLK
jgi:hypothetical protein